LIEHSLVLLRTPNESNLQPDLDRFQEQRIKLKRSQAEKHRREMQELKQQQQQQQQIDQYLKALNDLEQLKGDISRAEQQRAQLQMDVKGRKEEMRK
jgi:hypothetical protein